MERKWIIINSINVTPKVIAMIHLFWCSETGSQYHCSSDRLWTNVSHLTIATEVSPSHLLGLGMSHYTQLQDHILESIVFIYSILKVSYHSVNFPCLYFIITQNLRIDTWICLTSFNWNTYFKIIMFIQYFIQYCLFVCNNLGLYTCMSNWLWIQI